MGLQMSSKDIAIRVKNLSKCYHIYGEPQDRLKQSIFPRVQRLLGRPVRQYFKEFWALQDISFSVQKGETVGIIGRNGSGKSTLLQIICGTLTPTSGLIETQGRIAALLELGSGFNPEFTGRENVYLNGAILGLSKEEIDDRFDRIAAFADIGDFIERPVKMYSSGMIVRLAFSVQAMVDPDILIVDEALAVGDEKFQRKCFARLEELKDRGTSILFVSHSGVQIIELCDHVLLLDHGCRVMYSEPLKTVRAYQRLIYAPTEEQERLVQEYRDVDLLDGVELPVVAQQEISSEISVQAKSAFDPNLIPDTRHVYPVQGAEIESFQVLDTNDQPVNLLLPGEEYKVRFSGRFSENRNRVFFGVNFRSISGVVVTGQRYPEDGKYIQEIIAENEFSITFGFKMVLLPGTYFVSGGVWASEEPNCLHRILDALMIRVLPERSSSSFSFGYVNASSIQPHLQIR
ncbi:MAG: ABC transporter ATP-binding protein [Anaerolineales bacterium]